jgi:hypothetical protein
MVTRSPYERRSWDVSRFLGGTDIDPPLRANLLLPSDAEALKPLVLSFLKRIFEPGVCMGPKDVITHVVVFEPSLDRLLKDNLSDVELRSVYARAKAEVTK